MLRPSRSSLLPAEPACTLPLRYACCLLCLYIHTCHAYTYRSLLTILLALTLALQFNTIANRCGASLRRHERTHARTLILILHVVSIVFPRPARYLRDPLRGPVGD
jgi:hypothetical protein